MTVFLTKDPQPGSSGTKEPGPPTNSSAQDPKDPTTWRYTVKLDGGEAFKLKLANVRAEGAGVGGRSGGGGAVTVTGKAKGEGKKGRGGRT